MEVGDKFDGLIEELVKSGKTLDELLSEGGELRQLYKRIAERTLEAEMASHLGYAPHAAAGRGSGNSRNGKSKKALVGDHGSVEIAVPRDRNGSFEPKFIRKHQRRAEGFDERIIGLYARGMSTREIQSFLEEAYGVEVSPTFISQVTDAVLDEVRA